MVNYFNQKIVERHDDIMMLNNWMTEHNNFMLSVSWNTDADKAWYYDQKKAHLCYDV